MPCGADSDISTPITGGVFGTRNADQEGTPQNLNMLIRFGQLRQRCWKADWGGPGTGKPTEAEFLPVRGFASSTLRTASKEPLVSHNYLLVFTGESSFQALFGGAGFRPSIVGTPKLPSRVDLCPLTSDLSAACGCEIETLAMV